jgi:hypothetical protein
MNAKLFTVIVSYICENVISFYIGRLQIKSISLTWKLDRKRSKARVCKLFYVLYNYPTLGKSRFSLMEIISPLLLYYPIP